MNREKIEDALLAMGVPAANRGFEYIVDAVEIFDEKGVNIRITKDLYQTVAKKNNTTESRVERAIRYALSIARSCKGDYEVTNHYIGFMNNSNSSSIKQLYMMLKREGA